MDHYEAHAVYAGQREMDDDLFGIVISTYTRAEAIEDGTLMDVSDLAREAGFRYPVAVTAAVYYEYLTPPAEATGQDIVGRTWDMLTVLRVRAQQTDSDRLCFTVLFEMKDGDPLRSVEFKSVCGPGDAGEPVITVMLPSEC